MIFVNLVHMVVNVMGLHMFAVSKAPLQWSHSGCHNVSNHPPHDCLLNSLLKRRSKKTSKLCVTGLCAGNSPVTGEFPAQMASNAESVSIWWSHHLKGRTHLIMISTMQTNVLDKITVYEYRLLCYYGNVRLINLHFVGAFLFCLLNR